MITGILLAAGKGKRFGGDKLLCPLADGVPLAVAAARRLVSVLPQSLAVVRADAAELARRLAAEGMAVVVNPQAEQGMGMSLACGVAAAARAEGWVISLGDMPFIQPATIRGIVDLLETGVAIVAPVYRGRRGHPVGFQGVFGEQLAGLNGDRGAQELLQRHAERLYCWPVDDPGVLLDIDTRDDLVWQEQAREAGGVGHNSAPYCTL